MQTNIKEAIAQVFDEIAIGLAGGGFRVRTRVGLTLIGSEHGEAEMLRGAELAQAKDATLEVIVIGPAMQTVLPLVEATDVKDAQEKMDAMLMDGRLDAAVAMHYSFPIGVSTVGRVVAPGTGRETMIASTTGTSDTERVSALLKNTIASIAVAKACGNEQPTIGILNIDGARQLERALAKLAAGGYAITFANSTREDGGAIMRGNDLLQGIPDICVMDSLTGNVVMKMMSAFTTGGNFESIGDGYGPGVGEGADRIVGIISRASGAPVVAGAIRYMGACARGKLLDKVNDEFACAKKAGLAAILNSLSVDGKKEINVKQAVMPKAKVVTEEITGVEILSLEDAVQALWRKDIYATSGMGCTGPVIMVAGEDNGTALDALREAGYL